MNPYKQIDFVFFYIKERTERGAILGYFNIWNHVEKTPDIKINKTMFDEIINRLIVDGVVGELSSPDSQKMYFVTFDGLLFAGYQQSEIDEEEDKVYKKNLEVSSLKTSSYVAHLTFWIAVGSIAAALYYILEILNHWFYIYPKK